MNEKLLRQLQSPDPAARIWAIEQLCELGLRDSDVSWIIDSVDVSARVNLAEAIQQCGASAGPWMPTFVLPWAVKEHDKRVLRALGSTFDSIIAKLGENLDESSRIKWHRIASECEKFIPHLIRKAESCERLELLTEVARILDVFGNRARDATETIIRGFLFPSWDAHDYCQIETSLTEIYPSWRELRIGKEVIDELRGRLEKAEVPPLVVNCLDWPNREVDFLNSVKRYTPNLLALRVALKDWCTEPQVQRWRGLLLPRLVLRTGRDWVDNWLRHEVMDQLDFVDPIWRNSECGQRFLHQLVERLRTADTATATAILCAIASFYKHANAVIPSLRDFALHPPFADEGKTGLLASHVLCLLGDRSDAARAPCTALHDARLLEVVT